MAATGRKASDGSERSWRQHSSRRFRIQPATVRPAPPADISDFTLRFNALLDGLAILRLRQSQPSRKRLIELAMTTARAELTWDAAAARADR